MDAPPALSDEPSWCPLCEWWVEHCPECGNTSCNGGGCDHCHARFRYLVESYPYAEKEPPPDRESPEEYLERIFAWTPSKPPA